MSFIGASNTSLNNQPIKKLDEAIKDAQAGSMANQGGKNSTNTDRLPKLVFLGVAGFTLLASIVIIIIGNPHTLSNPVDPDGRACGSGDIEDYPYIYFVTPTKQYLSRTVCVKECKQYNTQPKPGDSLECATNSLVTSCKLNIPKSEDKSTQVMLYDTKLYLNKVCMPMNVAYYKYVFEALNINKVDQMLSDFYITFPFIALFAIITFLLSYATKYIISNNDYREQTRLGFFIISTLGFLALGVCFLIRGIHILTAKPPDDKDVIGNPDALQSNVDSSNSTKTGNIVFSIFCFINCFLFIQQWREKKNESIKEISNEILSFISTIIAEENLTYIPIAAFVAFILLFGFFFRVILNIFSLGSVQSEEEVVLPFQKFQTNPLAKIFAVILFIGYFWMFIFIIQLCEFLVYKLSMSYIELLERKSRNVVKQSDVEKQEEEENIAENDKSFFINELKVILTYYIGTIALCSILSFLFYYPRSILEWIDTSRQYQEQDNNKGSFYSIQVIISDAYRNSFLKSVQPYGFLRVANTQDGFLKSGGYVQKIIDNTERWYEEMLDGGELFENEMKFSICFLISLCFLFFVEQFDKFEVSSIMVPVGLMVIVSYVISLLYVNMYGSIYSTFIIFNLLKQELIAEKEHKENQPLQPLHYENDLKIFKERLQIILTEMKNQQQLKEKQENKK